MYIVVSFDFGGTSFQKIHCLSNDYVVALSIYARLTEALELHNEKTDCGFIIAELLQISENYENDEGYCFYWPSKYDKKDTRITVIKTTSNN